MPNRILKESICTSESIDSLTEFQEVFFYRLIVNCDDFGRFDARPKILSSRLFPLRPVAIELIQQAIDALTREGMILLYSVGGKEYLQVNAWLKHQQKRASKSKYPSPDDCDLIEELRTYPHMISDDIKCPRESRIENTRIENREAESEYELADDDAKAIQSEQTRVLEAAEDAGFPKSNTVRASLIALYSEHGLDKMLNGINECATHSAASVAYLKAVLAGSGRRRSHQRTSADNFEQRDYSGVQEEMVKSLDDEVAEFLAKENET